MKNVKKYIYMLIVVVITGFVACNDNEWDNHVGNTDEVLASDILERIKADPNLSQFYTALVKTGYAEVLSQPVNFTVFAPQNSAWTGVDMNDVEALNDIVAYHIGYGRLTSANLSQAASVKMVNTKNVRKESGLFGGATVITADQPSGNGVVHTIDKFFEMKKNIYEYISSEYSTLDQVKYLQSLDSLVMDKEKSVSKGVNDKGQIIYDTIWTNENSFLKYYPIDNEDSLVTYIVLKDFGFNHLKTKYAPYFVQTGADKETEDVVASEKLVQYNICQDLVVSLSGIIDITSQTDTVINVAGMKVPIKGGTIEKTYNASNGKVYIIDQSNILLREKIKPIIIEGEDYYAAAASAPIFTRYKLWASGEKDIMVNCGNYQVDTVYTTGVSGQDSTYTITSNYYWDPSNNRANITNFNLSYRAEVNSVDYEIYYVAYDDIEWHYDTIYVHRIEQKLFISMPNRPVLSKGVSGQVNAVINNYLGDTRCFVGQGLAGVHEETKLVQWDLQNNTTQLLKSAVAGSDAEVMKVPQSGTLTMWLCNTARSTAANAQGMLFLDYIKLVPKLPAE